MCVCVCVCVCVYVCVCVCVCVCVWGGYLETDVNSVSTERRTSTHLAEVLEVLECLLGESEPPLARGSHAGLLPARAGGLGEVAGLDGRVQLLLRQCPPILRGLALWGGDRRGRVGSAVYDVTSHPLNLAVASYPDLPPRLYLAAMEKSRTAAR